MADETLKATVKLDSNDVEAALGRIVSFVQAVKAEFTEAGNASEVAMDKTATGTNKAKKEVNGLAASLEGATRAASGLGTLMELLGIESSGGAAHVRLMNEALKELSAAAVPLLAVVVAVELVSKAFETFKEAIGIAGATSQAMNLLSVVTSNQGKNWSKLKDEINEYLEVAEKTSGFTRTELVTGLQQLAVAGITGADAITFQKTAMELSRATGASLAESETTLIKASEGQTRGLLALGIVRKEDIANMKTQQDMLDAVHSRVADAAEAYGNSLPGALSVLHGVWDSLLDSMGKASQGPLTSMVQGFTSSLLGIKEAYDKLVSQVHNSLNNLYLEHKEFFDVIKDTFNALFITVGAIVRVAWDYIVGITRSQLDFLLGVVALLADLLTLNFGRMWEDIKKYFGGAFTHLLGSFGNFGDNLLTIGKSIASNLKDVFVGIGTAMADSMTGNFVGAAAALVTTASTIMEGVKLKAWNLNGDSGSSTASIFAGHLPKPLETQTPKLEDNKQLPGKKAGSGASGGTQQFSVQELEKYSDKTNQASENEKILERNIKDLDDSLDVDREAVSSATTVHEQHIAKLKLEADTKDKLTEKGRLLQNAIDAESAATKGLNDKHTEAISEYNRLAGAANIYQNMLFQQATPVTIDQQNALAGLKDAASQAFKAIAESDKAVKENESNLDKNTNSLRANEKALAQLKDAHAAFLVALDAENIKLAQQKQDEEATYKQSVAVQKAYYEQQLSLLDQNDDENLTRIKELKGKINALEVDGYKERIDNLKKFNDEAEKNISTVLDQIVVKHQSFSQIWKSIWDKMVQDMIASVAKMVVEGGVLKNIFGNIFGGGGSSGGSGGGGFSLGSLFNLGGGSGGGATPSFQGGTIDVTGGDLGANISPAALAATGNPVDVNIAQTGGTSLGHGGAIPTNVSQVAGNVLTGASIGGAIAGITGGNQTLGSLGGAIGGAFFGPVGGVIGGALGSLAGPHWGPSSNFPDRADPNYGQFEANWQGTNGNVSNGQTFNAIAQDNVTQGGTPVWKQMETWANAQTNISSLTTAQQSLLTQIKGLEGGNANADLGVSSLHNGVWTLANGQNISFGDAQALQNNYASNVGGGGNATVWSLTHAAPDFNTARVSQWGTYNQNTGQTTRTDIGPAGGNGVVTTQPININVHVAGVIGTKEQIALEIADVFQKNNYFNNRNMRVAR